MESSALAELIQQLELKLLQTDLNANPALIDELLAQDFEEIDNQGQLHGRKEVIDWLKCKDPDLQWAFRDFRVKALSNDLLLAIYTVQKPDQAGDQVPGSIRTSLWQCQGNNWKMIFHQATKITGASAS
ncbi:MAG: nuclear transport factor 2 family protein [Proteobacteria bacterium]|nr:nuclear transport factor 2 family protein [Pseudomonadota bacterium]